MYIFIQRQRLVSISLGTWIRRLWLCWSMGGSLYSHPSVGLSSTLSHRRTASTKDELNQSSSSFHHYILTLLQLSSFFVLALCCTHIQHQSGQMHKMKSDTNNYSIPLWYARFRVHSRSALYTSLFFLVFLLHIISQHQNYMGIHTCMMCTIILLPRTPPPPPTTFLSSCLLQHVSGIRSYLNTGYMYMQKFASKMYFAKMHSILYQTPDIATDNRLSCQETYIRWCTLTFTETLFFANNMTYYYKNVYLFHSACSPA